MLRHLLGSIFRRPRRPLAARPRRDRRPGLLELEPRVVLSTITWLQPTSGDFDDPARWAGGQVPTAADDAVIPFAGITVSHATGAADSVHSLTSQAALDLSAGSLTVGNSAASASAIDASLRVHDAAALTLSHVTLRGSGALTNAGTLTLSDATIDVALQNFSGVLTANGVGAIDNTAGRPFVNGPDATLRVVPFDPTRSVPGVLTFSNGFTNQGVLEIGTAANGDADVRVQAGTLVNAPGATLSFPTQVFSTSTLEANLDNQGTVIDVGAFSFVGTGTSTVTNEGTIEVTPPPDAPLPSRLNFNTSSFTNTGTIQLPSLQSAVAVRGGTFEQAGTATGLGRFELVRTHAHFPGDLSTGTVGLALVNSTLDLSGGTLTNAAGRNLEIDGGTINAPVVNLGSLTVGFGSTASTINGQLTNAAGGTVVLTGSGTSGSVVLAVTGGITNSGSITLAADVANPEVPEAPLVVLNVTGGPLANLPGGVVSASADSRTVPGPIVVNAALDNQGTVTVETVGGLTLTGLPTNSGALEVRSGALTVSLPGPGAALANSGSLTVGPAGQLILQGGDFVNTGSVAIDQGSLLVQDGDYVQADGLTQLAGGTLGTASPTSAVRVEGGSLAGPGTVASSLVNDAVVDATRLVVRGDYTQGAGADLVVEVAGVGPPDALAVAGQATLDGTLTVQLTGGLVPASGDSVEVLSGGSVAGTFATLDGDGALFTPTFNPTNVTLVAN
jgi:hypothetical protein